MSTDIPIIPAPPIDTLTELRRQNSALLQRNVAGAGTTPPSPGELLGFLTAAAKLGRSLEDFETRETAQGIMDFWIANLLSAAPEASEGTRPFTLEPFDECQARADAHEAHQLRVEAVEAAQKVETLLPTAKDEIALKNVKISWIHDYVPRCLKPWAMSLAGRGSDTAVMERLLMSFVRLKEKSTEAYNVPVGENEAIFRETKAKSILDQLITAGVIKRQEADGATSYVLAHETLLQKWDFLAEIVSMRRAFRQLARGWENSGRQPGSLITSSVQLQEAIDLPHTDEMEDAFIEASRRAGESFRRIALTLVSTALIVLSLMVWRLVVKNDALQKASLAEKAALEAESAANAKLKAANAIIQQRAATAEVTQSRLYSLREVLLVPKDAIGKFVPPDMASFGVKYWDWSDSPASAPADKVFTAFPTPKEQKLSPRTSAILLDLLSKVTPPSSVEGRPLMEMFIPLDSTEAAYTKAKDLQAKLKEPPAPSADGFDFPARFPLLRRVVPTKTEPTQICYFFAGLGKEKASKDPDGQKKLEVADPDRKLADLAREKLTDAGFKNAIIVPMDDKTAPENFIQIRFARGSLD